MSGPSEQATFEVTEHFEITGRGIVILGHIRSGIFRAGMRIVCNSDAESFVVSSVEFADNIRERKHWVGLVIKDHPGKAHMVSAFPVGSLLTGQ